MKFVKNLVFAGLAAVALLACTADPEPKAVIYTIGDSTVKNGQGRGDGGLWGWGAPFAYFFDSTQVEVVNVARGGTSSRTYRTLGLWQPTLDSLKADDLVFSQFEVNCAGVLNDSSRAPASARVIRDESPHIDKHLAHEQDTVSAYGA